MNGGPDLKRRAVLALAGAPALVPWPLRAQDIPPRTIVWLGYGEAYKKRVRDELRSRGILGGRDIAITFRELPGGLEKEAEALADELVRSRPDIIVAVGHPVLTSLKRRTRDIPVIFYDLGPNPAQVGLVDSLARPGGNMTGSTMTGDQREYELRRWGTFKQLVPYLKRAAILIGKDFVTELEGRDPAWYAESKKILWAAGAELGIEFSMVEIPKEATRQAIAGMVAATSAQAAILQPYTPDEAAQFVYSSPIPTFCWGFDPVKKGCLLGFGFEGREGEGYAVSVVAQVLRGASPATIPVYVHNKVEFALNRRRARELGIEVPPSFLMRVKEVYE